MEASLDPFNLPSVNGDLGDERKIFLTFEDDNLHRCKPVSGDSVIVFNEIAVARGCLGRFQGCEMMGILKAYLQLPCSSFFGIMEKSLYKCFSIDENI